jgi:hypothetical protein
MMKTTKKTKTGRPGVGGWAVAGKATAVEVGTGNSFVNMKQGRLTNVYYVGGKEIAIG